LHPYGVFSAVSSDKHVDNLRLYLPDKHVDNLRLYLPYFMLFIHSS